MTRVDIEWTILVKKLEGADDEAAVIPGAVQRE